MKYKYIFLITSIFCLFLTKTTFALNQEDSFFKAQNCYYALDQNDKKIRENWFNCIKKFEKAYNQDTRGNYASASLFYVSKLYKELYDYSYLKDDKEQASLNFTKLVEQYPKSSYSKKVKKEYKELILKKTPPKPTKTKPTRNTKRNKDIQKHSYFTGINCYEMLLKKKHKQEEDYLFCIEKFKNAYSDYTEGGYASASLYQIIALYQRLNNRFPRNIYENETYEHYTKLIKNFPKSSYTKEIKKKAKIIKPTIYEQNSIKKMRSFAGPKYTRIVLDIDNKVDFNYKSFVENNNTFISINVNKVKLSSKVDTYPKIKSTVLSTAKFKQEKNSVSLVLNIKNFEEYKIFSLNSPFRIVIDIWEKKDENKKEEATILENIKNVAKNGDKHDLLKQFALGVKKIVIDAGHGGIDVGALGIVRGTYEKTITLQIAKKVKHRIEQELKCEVVMTRDRDKTLSLEERTAIANKEGADLFVSIHTNSNLSQHPYGIETYFLSLATDKNSISVAARENSVSEKSIGDLEMILSSLMKNSKINESRMLAEYVQKNLYNEMNPKYSKIKNKGVKQAPFYVLLGARMPSILIETSFISNERECKRLKRADYQNDLADGIVKGIKEYINKL